MKKYIRITIFLVALVTFLSCEDYLDKYPLDSPSNETFYSNTDEILMAVNACYNNITSMNLVNNNTIWPHLPDIMYRDNVTDISATRLTLILFQSFKTGELTPSSDLPAREWSSYYTGIGRTNALLAGMYKAEATTDSALFNRVKSEARVIRAICYLNLINDFGDVPLVTEPLDVETASNVSRTPKAEVLQFVYDELDDAAQYLPETYSGDDKGRITKGAAWAMKARIALYNKDYEIAREAAKAVMDLGVYHMHPDYRELFTYAGEYSREIILDLQFMSPDRVTDLHMYNAPRNDNGQSQSFPTEDLIASFECTDGLPIDESPLYDPNNPYANRDPRLFGAVILPRVWDGQDSITSYGTVFNGIEYMSSHETLYDTNGTTKLKESLSLKESTVLDTKTGTTIANQEVTNAYASFTGYCTLKYTDEANVENKSACSNNFILCRYAEVLLIYAEASVELNQIDQSVLDAINTIRARAYGNSTLMRTNIDADNYPKVSTMNQAELRKIIRRERKVELCFEGFRLDDLRRWGLMTKALNQRKNFGRPDNYTKLAKGDIPQIDDDGLVTLNYAEDKYGLNNEAQKLRFWEQFGVIPDAYKLLPIPLGEIQLNPSLEQNPGYN